MYVGAGTVDAFVDLGKVDEDDVKVDGDRTSATLRLPHRGALGEPALDPERSYAVSKQRPGSRPPRRPVLGQPERRAGRAEARGQATSADAAKDSELRRRAPRATPRRCSGACCTPSTSRRCGWSYGP
ncbi:DUF4230 domain-containing protein [Streptomyces thinghirensis]|nr:DUF4230 domain-containing protein [Streptomyces thinghirensis]